MMKQATTSSLPVFFNKGLECVLSRYCSIYLGLCMYGRFTVLRAILVGFLTDSGVYDGGQVSILSKGMICNDFGGCHCWEGSVDGYSGVTHCFLFYELKNNGKKLLVYFSEKAIISTKIYTNDSLYISESSNYFIGKTEKYYFIYNKDKKSTLVIPEREVSKFELHSEIPVKK